MLLYPYPATLMASTGIDEGQGRCFQA